MQLVRQNPYRVIGIMANASARDITRQQNKIKAYTRVGKDIISEYDFDFLPMLNRDADSIQQAFAQIQHNQNKVNHALFWFLNETPIDEIAIQHLKKGDKDKALEIWGKIFESHSLNTNNFSSFNNLSTLYLLDSHIDKRRRGIAMKSELIMSDVFTDFSHKVADISFNTDNSKQLDLFIDLILGAHPQITIIRKVDLFFRANEQAKAIVAEKLSAKPIHTIERLIEKTINDRKNNPETAYSYGEFLYQNATDSINNLRSILGDSDLKYQLFADNTAKEILQCSIDYFNKNQELNSHENYLKKAKQLVLHAQSLATNSITKDRIKDSLKTLEDLKNKEINSIIRFINEVEGIYLKTMSEVYFAVNIEKGRLRPGHRIDWNKVDNHIKNSVNWDKVVTTIIQILPPENIHKIARTEDEQKIKMYKHLVESLFEKLNYNQKRRLAYLRYWKVKPSTLQKTTSETEKMPSYLKILLWIVAIMAGMALLTTC